MTKLNIVLGVALLISCLVLVRVAYESRRVFADLDKARNEQRQLDAEFKRLDAERQIQATNLRVEKTAREKLRMATATPGVTAYVEDPAAASVASGAAR
jgi:cell division protein FtsL